MFGPEDKNYTHHHLHAQYLVSIILREQCITELYV